MSKISPKQHQANKQNAKKGGVKTEEGKQVSRLNAIKHGLLSKEVLLESESEEELVAFGKRVRSTLVPEGEIEHILVDRVVANGWRLKRMMQVEREMLEGDIRNTFLNPTVGGAVSFDLANSDTYSKFARYESGIERGFYKALHELQRVQSVRRGEGQSLPTAVDVDISADEMGSFGK